MVDISYDIRYDIYISRGDGLTQRAEHIVTGQYGFALLCDTSVALAIGTASADRNVIQRTKHTVTFIRRSFVHV